MKLGVQSSECLPSNRDCEAWEGISRFSKKSEIHGLNCFSWWQKILLVPLAQAALQSAPVPQPKEDTENIVKWNTFVCLTA